MSRIIKGRAPEYASLLGEQFDERIPFDITFDIVEKGDEDENRNQVKKNRSKTEVKAHKMILATFSSVFRAMFFGPMRESKDVIPIKETTVEAFKRLIDYFYQVDIDCSEIEIIELIDVVNLAEMYNVPKLKEELIHQMEKAPIAKENLVEVANLASNFSHFEDVSSTLLLNCARVFQREIFTEAEQDQFMQHQHERGEWARIAAANILALSKTLPPVCGNCREDEEDCLDGLLVEHQKIRRGLKVKVDGSQDDYMFWRCYVVESVVGSSEVNLRDEHNWTLISNYCTRLHNRLFLRYNCYPCIDIF